MSANRTPLVFHYNATGHHDDLTNALKTGPRDNYTAVAGALPYLGYNALRQHENIVRQVALRVKDTALTMRMLEALEIRLADPEPVPTTVVADLAKVYFGLKGTVLSLTTDEYQRWKLPATSLTMPASEAHILSLQSRAI